MMDIRRSEIKPVFVIASPPVCGGEISSPYAMEGFYEKL
jgi:hypothetical protein